MCIFLGMQTEDVIADLLRNIIPDNLFQATFAQTQTKYKTGDPIKEVNASSFSKNQTENKIRKYLEKSGEANYLGLISACTLLGLAASNLNEKGRLFLDLIESVSATVIAVVRWFLWTTPVGVISLIGVSLASAEHVGEVFSRLCLFIASITAGIIFQQLVLMSGVYFAFTRRNPYKYLISIARPWMISFASTTTAVAIPEMLAACEDKNRIDKRVSRFVIPFSVTINRSGSALYISGATVFVANVTGTELHIGDILLIWLLVTVVAMAIPAVPSASIVTTIMVLSSLNIPVDDVALLVAVEWYLDRLRSTGNVVSHTVCAAVIWVLCRKDLEHVHKKIELGNKIEETNVTEDEIIVDNGHISV
ncbi:excitatory amino acid transporter 3-like [Mercenaria mercenaria]|uniref:excitatory amino acid transporter 3-like n=1 Tax=Mercenaria mercenaria TaxID=6596 RepID=UPI00234E9972|nr:excitatory amino acid transporter 3-like [Mercenaria mercenaria]